VGGSLGIVNDNKVFKIFNVKKEVIFITGGDIEDDRAEMRR